MRTRLPKPGRNVAVGIGDDAAWVKTSKNTLVTCDLLIENFHFLRDMIPPRLLGRKALSVNLSDIAAMGGVPDYALVAVGFPKDVDLEYLDDLLDGLLEVSQEHGVEIIGGDTTAASALTIAVTVMGRPPSKGPVLRSGARPGDEIWVTGTLGDASLGFEILKKSREQELETGDLHFSSLAVKHFDPEPRVQAGLKLAGVSHAMIDVSDGILNDLTRILEESGSKKTLAAAVEVGRVPLSADFRNYFKGQPMRSKQALSLLLSGGEDYELLFTASPKSRAQIKKIGLGLGLPVTRIGRIKSAKKREIILLDKSGRKMPGPQHWFEHFPGPGRTAGR
jgi:thiamine-monophosphate kinase